ncbi:MAG: hypothetical protein JWL69_3963 [Phycisphaerales bacterium]|nr:hypothetical protein [Phycisphaerales bacterium]
MSRFAQSLESRTFLSATPVTKPTLLTDLGLVVVDAIEAKADLKTLAAIAKADAKIIQTDLKNLPKSNAPLLKTFKADVSKLLTLLTKDVNALLVPGAVLGKRSTGDGVSLLKKATAKLQAKLAAEDATLGIVTVAPLNKFQADSQSAGVSADLQALVMANPSSNSLAADAAKFLTDVPGQGSILNDAAIKFQTDIGGLATDLGSAASASSIFPTVTGTYSGTAKETVGNHVGRVAAMSIDFTSESPTGALTGTATIIDPVNGPGTFTVAGAVTASGVFSVTLTDPAGQGDDATLTGKLVGKTISGTYQTTKARQGTFTIHQ